MINANLHARYPVLLGIQTSDNPPQGHEVVCDGYGYNASTMYHHLNMGWYNEDNVWYNLPTIHPVQNAYQFNTIYECTYNIYASGYGEIIAGRVTDSLEIPLAGHRWSGRALTAASIPQLPTPTVFTLSPSCHPVSVTPYQPPRMGTASQQHCRLG